MQRVGVDPEAAEGPRTAIGIGAVREIIGAAHLRPYEGRTRVWIIETADRMSVDAANALLKLLEEPPPDVVLILLSDNPEGVLPTVRSRCQALEFRPLPVEAVSRILREEEGVGPEQAEVLARLSRGCLGWAIEAGRNDALHAAVHQRLERIADVIDGGLEARFAYCAELARRFQRDRGAGREEALPLAALAAGPAAHPAGAGGRRSRTCRGAAPSSGRPPPSARPRSCAGRRPSRAPSTCWSATPTRSWRWRR